MRWASFRTTAVQRLSWPRAWVQMPDAPYGYGSGSAYVGYNVVPQEVKYACAELALRYMIDGDLNPPLDRPTVREQVGVINVEYDRNAPESKRYVSVDAMLAPYLCGNANTARLVRT